MLKVFQTNRGGGIESDVLIAFLEFFNKYFPNLWEMSFSDSLIQNLRIFSGKFLNKTHELQNLLFDIGGLWSE